MASPARTLFGHVQKASSCHFTKNGADAPTREDTYACFATTHWSVVLAARQSADAQASAALEQWCRTYWYPLYAYARRRGYNPEDAQDLTQSFFVHFLRKDFLIGVAPAKGTFRSFLLTCLKHFLADEWEKARTAVSIAQVELHHPVGRGAANLCFFKRHGAQDVSAISEMVRQRAENRCEYCRLPQHTSALRFHIEHIVARQHGGSDDLANLALACPECNFQKGTNLSGIDPDTGTVTPLFHPRREVWAEHFSRDGARIVGKTATGRTTVWFLEMNLGDRLRWREMLAQLVQAPPWTDAAPALCRSFIPHTSVHAEG